MAVACLGTDIWCRARQQHRLLNANFHNPDRNRRGRHCDCRRCNSLSDCHNGQWRLRAFQPLYPLCIRNVQLDGVSPQEVNVVSDNVGIHHIQRPPLIRLILEQKRAITLKVSANYLDLRHVVDALH